MDLKFKKKESIAERPSIETRMRAWPDCLYREKEPLLRFELLREAEKQGLTPEENPLRRRLMEARYLGFKNGASKSDDNYLKMWIYMSFASDSAKRGKLPKRAQKDIMKVYDELGIRDMHSEEELLLLYREIYQMTLLYINLSLEDKRYGSVLFGFGRMSDERLARKIGGDVYKVGHNVPEILKFENYEVWEKAVKEAYLEVFPDEKDYLAALVAGEKVKES